MLEVVALVEAGAKGNFAGAHKRGEPHVPAFVGGRPAPNVVTGTLRRSIRHDTLHRYGLGDYGTDVGPSAIYGRRVELEYGYAYFEPAVKAIKPRIQGIAAAHWRRVIR